jgi:uncharacterized protein (DUF1501 family)
MTKLNLHRRSLLGAGSALMLSALGAHAAVAQTRGDRKLVLVILRGAMDGLAAVAPLADPRYASLRGRLALNSSAALALSDGFALHPRLTFLKQSWDARELAIMHAAATPYRERSHFDGQDVLESGGARVFAADDGWLNRALALTPGARGLAIADTVPLVLRGQAPTSSWAPSLAQDASADTLMRLGDLYAGDTLLAPALAEALRTQAIVEEAGAADMSGARPRRAGGAAYRGVAEPAARLLSAPDGPACAVLSFDGWDTHANQGAGEGLLAARLGGLDEALRTLKDGLGPTWRNTVVIVASEFGRTVAVNGSGGTDHGTGGVAFALGGAVRGGRMVGDWPTLAALHEGRDLAPANDMRGLFMAALRDHWGLNRAALNNTVFPGGVRAVGDLIA